MNDEEYKFFLQNLESKEEGNFVFFFNEERKIYIGTNPTENLILKLSFSLSINLLLFVLNKQEVAASKEVEAFQSEVKAVILPEKVRP